MRRHGFIGRQHELLDQPVRDVARAARDAGHLAKLVEFDQRLRHIEIDGAALDALAVQHQRQFAHQFEARTPAARSARASAASPSSSAWTLVYVIRSDAANDAAPKLLRDDVAALIDLEQHREHQPIDARLQRANLGGKLERQHRHRAIRKIDAGAAQEGFFVDRADPGCHVMADIGDVDLQRIIAVRQAIHPDGIVEIARGLAIDGDDVEGAKILPARPSRPARMMFEKVLRLLQNFRAENDAGYDACG